MPGNKTTKAARDRFYAERRQKIEQARAAVKAAPKPQPLPPDQQFPWLREAFDEAIESAEPSREKFRDRQSQINAATRAFSHGQLRRWCRITLDLDHLSEFISDWSFTDQPEEVPTLACQRLLDLRGL